MGSGLRRITLVAAAALIAGIAAQPLPASAYSSTNPARVLYVGDSIAVETNNTVTFFLQGTGKARVTTKAVGGMALCDFLEGKSEPSWIAASDKLPQLVKRVKPHVIVLQFWGNTWPLNLNFTPCMHGAAQGSQEYYNAYFWHALDAENQVTKAAKEAGIPRPKVRWVLQGPDKNMKSRPQTLNSYYTFAAGTVAGDGTIDAGKQVSMAVYPYAGVVKDRYAWTQWLPCTAFETQYGYCTSPAYGGVTKLHKDNDPIHFCLGNVVNGACDTTSPGIMRYGMQIAGDAGRLLGI